jgi:hypothetical protein
MIQCALNAFSKVTKNKERRKAVLHIQVLPQNAKVENCKEQGHKEYVHFMFDLILKMLNPKVKSCKKNKSQKKNHMHFTFKASLQIVKPSKLHFHNQFDP